MHTPGPWTAHEETKYRRAEVTHNERGDPIAEVFGPSADQRQANARLIAAAPEMLTALRDAENWLGELDAGPDTGAQALIAELRAAIAKAEGRDK